MPPLLNLYYTPDKIVTIIVVNEGTAFEEVHVNFQAHGFFRVTRSANKLWYNTLKDFSSGASVSVAVLRNDLIGLRAL